MNCNGQIMPCMSTNAYYSTSNPCWRPLASFVYLMPIRYLKRVDHFASSHVSTFLTPTSTRFMLLHLPHPPNQAPQTPAAGPTTYPPFAPYTSVPTSANLSASSSSKMSSSSSPSTSIPNNPTSPQTEDAIRGFMGEVFECWCKAIMNPFQGVEQVIGSAVFRGKVVAVGKKYL